LIQKTQTAIKPANIAINKNITEAIVHQWNAAMQRIVRLAAVYFVYRMIYHIRTLLQEMTQLQVNISEIRTISQQAQLSIREWTDEVVKLSSTYGTQLKDTAEGVYQTLSNQVAKGVDSIRFMNDALQFSVAAVTDAKTSVNLLTASLNAYDQSINSALETSASFFKTIELGRVRAADMSETIGRILPFASQLGVELDEVNAIIATMTIQGVKFDTASTQLRNIFLKLIKPTEAMKRLFKEWGVESGAAAIETFGFTEVMGRLAQKVKEGGQAVAGELFGRVRAIAGFATASRDNMQAYTDTLEQYRDKTKDYLNAVEIGFESNAKYLQIQLQQVRNYFQTTFSQAIIDNIASATKWIGGMSNAINLLIKGLKTALELYLAFRIVKWTSQAGSSFKILYTAIISNINAVSKYKTTLAGTTLATKKQNIELVRQAKVALDARKQLLSLTVTTVKYAAAMAALYYIYYKYNRVREEENNTIEAYNKLIGFSEDTNKVFERQLKERIADIDKENTAREKLNRIFNKDRLEEIAEANKEINKELEGLIKFVDRLRNGVLGEDSFLQTSQEFLLARCGCGHRRRGWRAGLAYGRIGRWLRPSSGRRGASSEGQAGR